MDIDAEIRAFLAFLEKHKNADMLLRGDGEVLVTLGCEGTFGGCCSNLHDMSGLTDALRELVAEQKDR